MKYTKKQLNAISYNYYKRQRARQEKALKDAGLVAEFEKSRYKSLTWFLRSKNIDY